MTSKYTSEEVANCIYRLRDLIRDRESFVSKDNEPDDPFLKDIFYLRMAIDILNDWKRK